MTGSHEAVSVSIDASPSAIGIEAVIGRQHDLEAQWRERTAALESATCLADVRSCIEGMLATARWQFSEEEKAMRAIAFPDYGAHRSDHQRLLSDASDMLRNIELSYGRDDWPALATFFRFWIDRHQRRHDRSFAGFARGGDGDAARPNA